jgi:hypothetical protein
LSEDNLPTTSSGIGQLAERSLHAALKEYLRQPGDEVEVKLGRYVIDLVRDDLLIEVQTRHLYALRPKLAALLDAGHRVHLVHPLPAERWIVRQDAAGRPLGRRKSPKRATVYDIFGELVRIPDLAAHPALTVEVLLIREEDIWRDDGQGSWRRGRWSVVDRRLLGVAATATLREPADYLALLPPSLPQPFTTRRLAEALHCHASLAQKMAYTLRRMALLEAAGKEGRSILYRSAMPLSGGGAEAGDSGAQF